MHPTGIGLLLSLVYFVVRSLLSALAPLRRSDLEREAELLVRNLLAGTYERPCLQPSEPHMADEEGGAKLGDYRGGRSRSIPTTTARDFNGADGEAFHPQLVDTLVGAAHAHM